MFKLSQALLTEKFTKKGVEWAFKYFRKLINLGFQDAYTIFSGLHNKVEIIDFIEDQIDEDKDFFWKYCNPFYPEANESQTLLIINGLEKNGRIHDLFNFMDRNKEKIETQMLSNILLNFGTGKVQSKDNRQVDSFNIKNLLKELQHREDKDNQSIITLELIFFEVFNEYSNKMPKTINYSLSTDPTFVLELLKYTFKPENVEAKDQDEDDNEIYFYSISYRNRFNSA